MKYISTIFTLFIFTSSFADLIHVPGTQPTIQDGINIASDSDTILVANGTYIENINFKGKAITVASRFLVDGNTSHINNTIIDGSQPSHPDSGSVVTFGSGEDTTSILMGFTITGGSGTITQYTYSGGTYSARAGGGIFCYNSGGYILNNKIINNSISNYIEAFGGGLCGFPIGSTAHVVIESNQIIDNHITGNNFSLGGGIQLTCNGRIIDNIISHNSCNSINSQATGGGVDCFSELPYRPMVYITNNRITHNSANGNQYPSGPGALGGGINSFNANLIISENEICYNELSASGSESVWGAGLFINGTQNVSEIDKNNISHNRVVSGIGWGGGMNLVAAYLLITNNLITRNSASSGGAMHIGTNSSVSLINNTIVENEALVQGGGIDYNVGAASTVIKNSIIWANQAPQGPQIQAGSGLLDVEYSNVQGTWPGLFNINDDPQLMDTLLTSGDTLFCCLPSGSPCIDMGDPDPAYNDPEDPNNLGYALWPSMGTVRNDMGAYGGPVRIITRIENGFKLTEDIPTRFLLYQNYPNPFNPSTTIEFDLPKSSEVSLKIFNILGEEVATLISDRLSAGSYSYEWSRPAGIASGVYMYRLQTGDYGETKKMVLMK